MPEVQLKESFQLSSGLKDDYTMTVYHSYFGTDANYQDGKRLLLIWEGEDDEGEAVTEKFSVGKDWITEDLGRTMMNPVSHAKSPNRSSIYGKVIEWMVKMAEEGDGTLLDIIQSRGEGTESGIWNNLRFHMKAVEIKFGKNLDPITKVMPVEFLGVVEESSTAPTAQPAPAARAPQASSNGTSPLDGASKPTQTMIRKLAASSDTHEDFIGTVLDIPAVASDNTLRAYLLDETESGFWANR